MGTGDRELSAAELTPEALEALWLGRWDAFWTRLHNLVFGPSPETRLEQFFLRLFWLLAGLSFLAIVMAALGVWKPFNGELGSAVDLLEETTGGKEKSEIIRNLFFAAAGLVGALGGLFQLYNSARRTRINATQARTAFEAERNDRFVKAAELLKEESQAVQVSGIYALQRLAEEESAGYRKTVVLVLAGFVRAQTGPESRAQRAVTQLKNAAKVLESGGASVNEAESAEDNERPSECVAAAVDALMALTDPEDGGEGLGELVDLRRCRLVGLDQPGRQMIRWRLSGADLEGANLWGANLERAKLVEANLGGANLERANLAEAKLRGAPLDFTGGVKTEQLAQAHNVGWPSHVPRPETGPYADESEATELGEEEEW